MDSYLWSVLCSIADIKMLESGDVNKAENNLLLYIRTIVNRERKKLGASEYHCDCYLSGNDCICGTNK